MRKITVTLAATVVATLVAGQAMAEGELAAKGGHPRRVAVDHRLSNQNARIDRERREGDITGAQARALHAQDKQIRAQERSMAGLDRSHLTKTDDRALLQQENAVSREIGK